MAAQEAQQPQNMEQLEQQAEDAALQKVIKEIKELSDGNDKKENDKIELDATLTNEFANKLDANTAQILLAELNKYQIPDGGSAPEGYYDLKNFLEMKANDNPIKKENNITDVDDEATVKNLSENQTNLINATISTYFTEKNGNQNNENYIDISKISEETQEFKNIKDTLGNIKTILDHPTKGNIQKLQQFIYNNLDEGEKQGYLDANKDKQTKPNPTNYKKIVWDGTYGKSTNENLDKFLSKTKNYLKDYQEGKNVVDKHTQEADRIEKKRNEISKENAEINADNINVTLRGKWKEMNESMLPAEKKQISDKLNSYVQLREYLPQNVREILCKTRAALESTSNSEDKSEAVFTLENKLNELGFMPKDATDGNNGVDGKFGNKTYDALINCIETSLKNSVEIKAEKITVELRGKWKDMNKNELNKEKGYMVEELNLHRDNREKLTYNQKKVLILTKAALESTSNSEDKSEAVFTLENELNNLGFMPKDATEGHNGVDGKFGDKTYCAIMDCLEGQTPQFLKSPDKTAPESPVKAPGKSPDKIGNKNTISLTGLIQALVSGGRRNALSYMLGGETNADKYKNNKNIDKDNNTVKQALSLINLAENVNGLEEIKNILENGTEEDIRGLQMKLWTPTNNLMITGKIDEQTANVLKGYITNENNKKEKPSKALDYCALSGYTEKANITADSSTGWAGGSTYEMIGGFSEKSYMFKGYKVEGNTNKTFIASNLELSADNKVKIGANTIIQYSDGSKDVYTNSVLTQYDSAGNKIESQNNGQVNTGANPENGNNAANNANTNPDKTTNGGQNAAPAAENGNNAAPAATNSNNTANAANNQNTAPATTPTTTNTSGGAPASTGTPAAS